MRRPVDSFTKISSVHGQITNMGKFGRHLGNDYAGGERTLKATVSGKITFAGSSAALGNYYELVEDGNNRIHRLAHNKSLNQRVGNHVTEGQAIGVTGNTGISTGPHVHWDVRAAGTKWDSSFANFYNPESLIASQVAKMPPLWSAIRLKKGYPRNTFYPGSAQSTGKTINPNDNTWVFTIRGFDPKYPYRVIINSASGGGDNVALALYYTDGKLIEGWERV